MTNETKWLEQAARNVVLRANDLGLTDLSHVGSGIGASVFRATTSDGTAVAVKVPRARWRPNHNDGVVDSRWFPQREISIYELVRLHGLPSPELVHNHFGDDDFDFVVYSYVEHDDSFPSGRELGELLARIHSVAVPPSVAERVSPRPMEKILADRMAARAVTLYELTGRHLQIPHQDWIIGTLAGQYERSLLHLDIRPVNILARQGQVAAVIDWDNALMGDPELEIVRMRIFGDYAPIEGEALEHVQESPRFEGLPTRFGSCTPWTPLSCWRFYSRLRLRTGPGLVENSSD